MTSMVLGNHSRRYLSCSRQSKRADDLLKAPAYCLLLEASFLRKRQHALSHLHFLRVTYFRLEASHTETTLENKYAFC
jgi:hypothetical protein